MYRRPKEISKTKHRKRIWEIFDWHYDGTGEGFLTRSAYRKKRSPSDWRSRSRRKTDKYFKILERRKERRKNLRELRKLLPQL